MAHSAAGGVGFGAGTCHLRSHTALESRADGLCYGQARQLGEDWCGLFFDPPLEFFRDHTHTHRFIYTVYMDTVCIPSLPRDASHDYLRALYIYFCTIASFATGSANRVTQAQ